MKKHPIDKLFAEKLGNIEREPSATAWAKLENNLQARRNRKRRTIWLSFAAAAVVMLFTVGALLFNQPVDAPRVAAGAQKPKPPTGQQTIAKPESAAEKEKQVAQTPDAPVMAKAETTDAERKPETEITSQQPGKTIRPAESKLVEQPAIQPVEPAEVTLAVTGNTPGLPTLETTVSTVTQPEVVVMVQIDASQPEVAEQTEPAKEPETEKESKAGKLFAKLKKLKHGEFEELGIRPEQILAFAKDKDKKNAD